MKRLTEVDIRIIIAKHFNVDENNVELNNVDDWRYEEWICDVDVGNDIDF